MGLNQLYVAQSDHPLFRYLSSEERRRVEDLGELVRLDEGDYLIHERDHDSTLYAIEDGHLEIVSGSGDDEVRIATVGPGDVLGEVSFIDGSARSVSVRAAEQTTVRAWRTDSLVKELANDASLLGKFSVALNELLVERLRESVRRQALYRPA